MRKVTFMKWLTVRCWELSPILNFFIQQNIWCVWRQGSAWMLLNPLPNHCISSYWGRNVATWVWFWGVHRHLLNTSAFFFIKNNKLIIFNNLTSAAGKPWYARAASLETNFWSIRSISALAIQHKHLLGIKLSYLKVIFEQLDGRAG